MKKPLPGPPIGTDRRLQSIGQQLRTVRKAVELRQEDLAERAGVARMTVQRIESDQIDPRLSTLQEMARALGMELLLVPQALAAEVQGFIRAGGRALAQPPGADAPRSIVDLLGDDS